MISIFLMFKHVHSNTVGKKSLLIYFPIIRLLLFILAEERSIYQRQNSLEVKVEVWGATLLVFPAPSLTSLKPLSSHSLPWTSVSLTSKSVNSAYLHRLLLALNPLMQ